MTKRETVTRRARVKKNDQGKKESRVQVRRERMKQD